MKKHINIILLITSTTLIISSIILGFTIQVPDLPVIKESIRNIFFHVPLWFSMITMFLISMINGIIYLSNENLKYDLKSVQAVNVGVYFGILGLITGMIWANFTWGKPWINDLKLNGALIALLIYFAYLILRKSVKKQVIRAKISVVYNIFAFFVLIIFIFILPRLSSASIHPGQSGDSLTVFTLTGNMKYIFFMAIIGWILLGIWLYKKLLKINILKQKIENLKTF